MLVVFCFQSTIASLSREAVMGAINCLDSN